MISSTEQKSKNILWHQSNVKREEREKLNGHSSCAIWLTGLSGSGKSTIACKLERILTNRGIRTYILDGDNIRHGLNKNLGFSPEERTENIRRIGEVTRLLVDAGIIVITAFISPYKKDRDQVRDLLKNDFVEVHVDCNVKECEKRDVKGLYKKARAGIIPNFTGISAPFEDPMNAEIILNTAEQTIEESTQYIITYLEQNSIIVSSTEK